MDRTKIKLKDLLKKDEMIIVPELHDCASARAAEINGFECIMLSSGDFACALTGIPDLQLLSIDEFCMITERITEAVRMPLIIDADDGFGFGRALNTWYACKRLAKAGASGILITDAAAQSKAGLIPVEEACVRFRAAKDGMLEAGTDAFLIARCDENLLEHFDAAADRMRRYVEAGADMICPLGLNGVPWQRKAEIAARISENVPGLLWYPDLGSHEGIPDVDLDEMAKLRYKMVGVHYSMHAAMIAMLDAGRHVMESKTNVYVHTHYDDTGYKCFSPMTFYLRDGYWAEKESRYVVNPEDALAKRITPFFVREDDAF